MSPAVRRNGTKRSDVEYRGITKLSGRTRAGWEIPRETVPGVAGVLLLRREFNEVEEERLLRR